MVVKGIYSSVIILAFGSINLEELEFNNDLVFNNNDENDRNNEIGYI